MTTSARNEQTARLECQRDFCQRRDGAQKIANQGKRKWRVAVIQNKHQLQTQDSKPECSCNKYLLSCLMQILERGNAADERAFRASTALAALVTDKAKRHPDDFRLRGRPSLWNTV